MEPRIIIPIKSIHNFKYMLNYTFIEKEEQIKSLAGAQMEVLNIGSSQPIDYRLLTSRKTLVEYHSPEVN